METYQREIGTPTHESYRQVRRNVTQLLSALPAGEEPRVPACPQWTIRELLEHLVFVAATAAGRLSGTPRRYSAPHHRPATGGGLSALLADWEELGAEADALLADRGGRSGSILVMDAFTHELDIRYALGAELPIEHPAFACAFEVVASGFAAAVTAHRLPAVRLVTTDPVGTRWTLGDGTPAATVTAGRLDLYRSLAGRRSHDQITALGWDRDSHRWLPAFTWGPFTPPGSPVEPLQSLGGIPEEVREHPRRVTH